MNQFNSYHQEKILQNIIPEIGNALGSVLSATQALLNGAEKDPVFRRDLLGEMENNLRYLRYLFENGVLLKTIRSGKLELYRRELDTSDWLENFVDLWQKMVPTKGLTWSVVIPPALPSIWADADLLDQALGNILFAGMVSAPKDTKITFTSRLDNAGSDLFIEICDFGPWVSHELLSMILESLDQPSKHPRLKNGMGLGLGLAYQIIQAHGGMLTSTTGRENECCFGIRLPLE